jgi:hypothetical protein
MPAISLSENVERNDGMPPGPATIAAAVSSGVACSSEGASRSNAWAPPMPVALWQAAQCNRYWAPPLARSPDPGWTTGRSGPSTNPLVYATIASISAASYAGSDRRIGSSASAIGMRPVLSA